MNDQAKCVYFIYQTIHEFVLKDLVMTWKVTFNQFLDSMIPV